MTILTVSNVTKIYPAKHGLLRHGTAEMRALDGVSFSVRRGQCLGIAGESGSGKTTLSRLILGLEKPTSGSIVFDGSDLAALSPRQLRRLRARIQIVFQDPYASLNPRMSIRDIIAEPMEVHRDVVGLNSRQITERVVELLELVRMDAASIKRLPHEFSGGQRQRIGIARALACKPDLIVLDEPTSALDVSVQAQVLELLIKLQAEMGLTYILISHDLAVIRYLCDEMALIHRGRIAEYGAIDRIFAAPSTDYARQLIAATPDLDPDKSPFNSA